MKACAKCGEIKPLDQFYVSKNGPKGRHSYCKPCSSSYYKAIGKKRATPEQRSRWTLMTRYGMTAEEWQKMITAQDGVCAICKKQMRRPVVDHDHKTGAVRGILCHPCNIKLSAVENTEFLDLALVYLEAHK